MKGKLGGGDGEWLGKGFAVGAGRSQAGRGPRGEIFIRMSVSRQIDAVRTEVLRTLGITMCENKIIMCLCQDSSSSSPSYINNRTEISLPWRRRKYPAEARGYPGRRRTAAGFTMAISPLHARLLVGLNVLRCQGWLTPRGRLRRRNTFLLGGRIPLFI